MSAGFLMQVVSGAWMLAFDLNVRMVILILISLVQGFSVGLICAPLVGGGLRHAGAGRAGRSLGNLSSSAQLRFKLLYFPLDRRDRAGHRRQLQPAWRR
jgi:hypothetical protein